MRLQGSRVVVTGLSAVVVLALTALSCGKDSNSVTGPSAGSSPTAMSVSGTWTGTYQSDAACTDSAATATFQQSGSTVTGTVTAGGCGVHGTFRGSVKGSTLTGAVAMVGCTGGAASGSVSASGLSMSLDDFRKPLVTGDQVVIPGGTLTLRR